MKISVKIAKSHKNVRFGDIYKDIWQKCANNAFVYFGCF